MEAAMAGSNEGPSDPAGGGKGDSGKEGNGSV